MRSIRAVVTDLDGTVADHEGHVSTATVRAAAELAALGVPLIVATARTPAGVAALEPLLPWVTVAVCCGGALGWSPKAGQVLWRDTIPPSSVDRMVRFTVRRLPAAGIGAHDGQQWRVTEAFAALRLTRRGLVRIVTTAEIVDRPICAMSICHPSTSSEDLLGALADAGVYPPLTMTYSASNLVDIAPAGIDKATGVSRALAAAGVDPVHAIAFGDMPNDLPMFVLCGQGVAMANAHPDVIAAATTVAACVHGDGFARTLAELGLVSASRDHAHEGRGGRCRACGPAVGGSHERR